MTEEQLRIARNTYSALVHAKEQFRSLEKIIVGASAILLCRQNNLDESTYIFGDEISFLVELLEYRRKEVIALEREFASL